MNEQGTCRVGALGGASVIHSVIQPRYFASVADLRDGGRDKQQRHNLRLERGIRTYRAPKGQPEYFFFRLRLHFGPPLASGAGMRVAVSRRLAVLTLQDRWTDGRGDAAVRAMSTSHFSWFGG